MAAFIHNIFVVLVALAAVCSCLAARLEYVRPLKLNQRPLARQQAAVTPYPPAGVVPEIPFDLPTDGKLIAPDNTYLPPVDGPAQTYGPPAKTYGPPEVDIVEEVAANEQPAPEEPNTEQPDEEEVSSEQPDEEENQIPEDDIKTSDEIEAEVRRVEEEEGLTDPLPERIVSSRRNRQSAAKLQAQPVYVISYNGQLYRLLQ